MTARTEAIRRDDAARATRSWRRRLLLGDGLFLLVAGGVQVVFEWLSFSSGSGPLGATFEGSPFTLGWVEAHGLACLLGLLLLSVAARGARREWHVVALGVHLLLGGANVLFWGSFVAFDTVPLGIAATVAHACFVIAHGWAHVRSAPTSTS